MVKHLDNTFDMYKETVDPDYQVRQIVEGEKNRIDLKKVKIDKEYETKTRKNMLMASDTSRKYAYYRIYIVLSFIAMVSFGSVYLNSMFSLVSESTLDLFIIVVVSLGLMYLFILYIDIMKRDRVDFNKIDFAALMQPKDETNAASADSSSVDTDGTQINVTTTPLCVGKSCCPEGSIFVDNKCTKKEGFSGTIKPYSKGQTDYMLL